jgi:hypothetical protein
MDIRLSWLQWLLSGAFMLIALVVGGMAWQEFTHAKVVVEWTTASELSTAGFNLYRSYSKDGVYEKVNPELVPASPDPLTGGSHTYLDEQVKAGTTYYYRLEEVELNGNAARYGPIEVQARRGGSFQLAISISALVIGVFTSVRAVRRTGCCGYLSEIEN